jgi:hypothetical protein
LKSYCVCPVSAKSIGEEFSIRDDNTFVKIAGTQLISMKVLHLKLLTFMVEDVPLPVNYRYECHHGKNEYEKHCNESYHATD